MAECDVYWTSHGCHLEMGHDGPHECRTPEVVNDEAVMEVCCQWRGSIPEDAKDFEEFAGERRDPLPPWWGPWYESTGFRMRSTHVRD